MYEKYNLRINPFTDQSLNYPIVDRVATEDEMQHKLAQFVWSKNPAIIPLQGDYGVGKTFFLMSVEKKIRDGTFFKERKTRALASYITAVFPQAPSQYIHYVYSQSMKRIGSERFRKMVEGLNKLKDKENSLQHLNRDFRNALLNFEENEEIAWTYFSGETISKNEAGKIKVGQSIKNDEQSLTAFLDFLAFLNIIDYQSLVLLIDEFEYLFAKGSKKGAQFLNTFRFLYDRALERFSSGEDIANPIFVPACTIFTWREISSEAVNQALGTKPFVDRSQDAITLQPFTAEETRKLMQGRLDKWRIDRSDTKRMGLFPFVDEKGDNNPFDYIAKVNDGLPRLILRNTATMLDRAYEKKYERIGLKEVKDLVRDLGIVLTKE